MINYDILQNFFIITYYKYFILLYIIKWIYYKIFYNKNEKIIKNK